jgi:predicted nuclease of predicted toxin-antitoxin system
VARRDVRRERQGAGEIGLRDADDDVLFDAAKNFGNVVVVTKDYDFVEMVLRRGAPPQVLWLSFGNMPTVGIHVKLRQSSPAALDLLRNGDPLVEIA